MDSNQKEIRQPNYSTIHIRNQKLPLDKPLVMGILNATPDSFSDGGEFNAVDDALERIAAMIEEGAAIIDIGGESTRPGAEPVPVQVEKDRVLPILKQGVQQFPETYFSVDTRTFEVAEASLQAGAHIINDVSGLQKEPRLAALCSEYRTGYILMHSQGEPRDMQEDPHYEDVVGDIKEFFRTQIEKAREAGLEDIIIDPGFGFGKTLEHNLTLFTELNQFSELGCPMMVGASRKSMFDQILGGREPRGRVTATVAAHYDAMMQGARILRVHDVREAHDSVQVFNAIHHGKQKT